MVLFYVVLTPIWLGLRALAWVAELRSRRDVRCPIESDTVDERVDLALRAEAGDAEPRQLARVAVATPAARCGARRRRVSRDSRKHVPQRLAVAVPELLAPHHPARAFRRTSRGSQTRRGRSSQTIVSARSSGEVAELAAVAHRRSPMRRRATIGSTSAAKLVGVQLASNRAGGGSRPARRTARRAAPASRAPERRVAAAARGREDDDPLASPADSSPAHRIRAVRLVYAFDEEAPGGRELLGRQGDRARRDDGARRARPGRVHDHHRRVPRDDETGRGAGRALAARSTSTSRGSRSARASGSATRPTRCSSRSARERRSRCPG